MNKTLTKILAVALFASIAAPALADGRGDRDGRDGYRGYDAPRYYQGRGNWNDRGDNGWHHGHKYGYNRDAYYVTPYTNHHE
jgi:hypothetical protein